jgi:hypothetical protein
MEYTVAANDGVEPIIGIWQILRVPLATIDRRSVPTGGGDHGLREVDSAYLGTTLRSSQGKHTVSRADVEHVTSANDPSCIERDLNRLRGQRTKDSFVTLGHRVPSASLKVSKGVRLVRHLDWHIPPPIRVSQRR